MDASPLIYLVKLDALDVFAVTGVHPLIPGSVFEETAKPALTYRHPDALRIEEAGLSGRLEVVELTPGETVEATRLHGRIPSMHRGECEVLAVAAVRRIPAVIHETRARIIAQVLGIAIVDVVQLLFEGTRDGDLLEERIRGFAGLVNLRLADTEALLDLAARRRLR